MSIGEGFRDVRPGRQMQHRYVRRLRLANDVRSVKVARDAVAGALAQVGWSEEAIEQARVVVSELATNALEHARTGFELTVRVEDTGPSGLGSGEIGRRGQIGWIEIIDGSPERLPQQLDPADETPGGMGLHLVEALADDWGVERETARKVVWARVRASGAGG
jgi:anti-sigma regulatory factor (Ser/Thr protein kinase)